MVDTQAPLPRSDDDPTPFAALRREVQTQSALRAAITASCRRAETEAVPPLLALAALAPDEAERAAATARTLVQRLRTKARPGPVNDLMREYALSSPEGVALMCLAEALLRIPDNATRDALIRDKIARGDWRSHLGHSTSLLVNAATWGLLVTGRLTATASEAKLSAALTRLIARGGEPIIRRAVDLMMRLLGEQFVAGETIAQAITHARAQEAKGFRYSYDMLGEAAMTATAATRYFASYKDAIEAIGGAAAGRGVIEGPGISVKLSALHPRYSRGKRMRTMSELLPRLKHLAARAKQVDIGLNIDAEEADRLDISLDLLEVLALDPDLAGWNGLGFVVQAYGKRAPFVIDWLADLGKRSDRRLMVRLVKGAYWDAEIKRAQVDGMDEFPVFTRKVYTDVCFLACARKMLTSPRQIFPQFATHNAQTLAAVMEMAGADFVPAQYEFQCLHGMGEPLYEQVVGNGVLRRPCRIYAPVGTHETLLAYLVRRLLENGANSSFVNRIADASVPIDDLIEDPVAQARRITPVGAPHPKIALPQDLYGPLRRNSAGLDLADEARLAELADALQSETRQARTKACGRPVRNPADHSDIVGYVTDSTPADIDAALASAATATWGQQSAADRAACLRRAADATEERRAALIGLAVREAGKTYANAVGEVREAVDFLRYYATEAERALSAGNSVPLGPVACISPWNFPLAIFTGQVAAALAAGNAVLAKPAEETPLIAAEAIRILHASGVPTNALHLLQGDGLLGATLVADHRVQGVIFTGSTDVARMIQRQLAQRLTVTGRPVPLIAETGGLNAMIVDSSALAEQVVADVLASAFDSAGQRCSALRILCLQHEIADHTLDMLKGAMRELEVGDSISLATDVGPLITQDARDAINTYVETMRERGFAVTAAPLPPAAVRGTFVAPTLIEVTSVRDVEREVFGPVLHVLRYRRGELNKLVEAIDATGYGLSFGLHTRIDETIDHVLRRIGAGNIYVNRNIIGATVGVQPFGGSGLSGTGPKAGGPRYLRRLLQNPPPAAAHLPRAEPPALTQFIAWLLQTQRQAIADRCVWYSKHAAHAMHMTLSGPVGESNVYSVRAHGIIAALGPGQDTVLMQLGAILWSGNHAVVEADAGAGDLLATLPPLVGQNIRLVASIDAVPELRAVLFAQGGAPLIALNQRIAARPGPIIQVQAVTGADQHYDLDRLLQERSVATNTAAAGGNASLLALAD